jgi:RNA recognition motif-containing protein
MTKRIYVGNLAFSTTESALSDHFSQAGTVESVRLITDRDTGRSKGFGFIEMSNDEEADRAISELNGKDLDGRNLTVNEARPQERGTGGFGGGGRRGGRY